MIIPDKTPFFCEKIGIYFFFQKAVVFISTWLPSCLPMDSTFPMWMHQILLLCSCHQPLTPFERLTESFQRQFQQLHKMYPSQRLWVSLWDSHWHQYVQTIAVDVCNHCKKRPITNAKPPILCSTKHWIHMIWKHLNSNCIGKLLFAFSGIGVHFNHTWHASYVPGYILNKSWHHFIIFRDNISFDRITIVVICIHNNSRSTIECHDRNNTNKEQNHRLFCCIQWW